MARISRRRAKRRIRQLRQEVTREHSVLLMTAVGQNGRRGPSESRGPSSSCTRWRERYLARLLSPRHLSGDAGGRLVLMQAADLGLQDAHRLAQGARRARQLLRPEQDDQHDGDNQDLPRAVEQVTNHGSSSVRLAWYGFGA